MPNILQKLLDELKTRQSWCIYCGGEYVHSTKDGKPCILKGLWFPDDTNTEEEE